MKPVVLVNHLLEPGNRISGISNYLFALLESLLRLDQLQLVLVTCWTREQLPPSLRETSLIVETRPFIHSQPRNILDQNRVLHRLVRRYGADVVFNSNPLGGTLTSVPKVFVVHDLYFDVSPASYRWHHRLWWRLFFPLAARSASTLLCVSENTRRDLCRYHPGYAARCKVVLEAPCLSVTSRAARAAAKPGLFVANVSPNKGARTLVRAMSALADEGRELEVLHVGSDDEQRFPMYAAESGSRSGVWPVSLGRVSTERLSELYASARYLAFPSHYEGFGLPVVEAQAHGLPVIASDIPVLREVAGEGALFVPEGDPRALADAMKAIHDDDELFARLSTLARLNAARFSWERAARETTELLLQAIRRPAPEAAGI